MIPIITVLLNKLTKFHVTHLYKLLYSYYIEKRERMEEQPFQVKTPEYVSLQFQLANLGSRATASIIDYAIIIIAQILVFLGLAFLAGFTSEFYFFSSGWIIAIVFIILFVFNFGYFIILEYFWGGRTIGKRIIGIRVIQENGHNITLLSSIIRNFLRLID